MPSFYFSIKPHFLTQPWGVHRPDVYGQFGFEDHNGIDKRLAPDGLIRAPFDGVIFRRGYQPNGGGVFLTMMSDEMEFPAFKCRTPDGRVFNFAAAKCRTFTDFLHLENAYPAEGVRVKAGDVIAKGDSTGFSTGPHCHEQWRRVMWDGKAVLDVDRNTANNSFDPAQFMNGDYAADIQAVNLTKKIILILQQIIAQLQKRPA